MNNAITITGLKKSYNDLIAINNIDLNISKGEMFGLVGPDGAGKTSTIRILCGLTNFDEGEITLLGLDIKKQQELIKKKIGYLSQKFSLYGDLTVDENIEFFAQIHNVKSFKARRDQLLEFTRLTQFRKRLADKLSGGMKQKLALACTLIHKPEIVFLDEPTTGVDPVSRREFWKILSDLQKDGITILMTTPYLDEAERCNTVALMNNGKIISCDTPENIKRSLNFDLVELVCSPIRSAYKILKEETNYEIQLYGDRIHLMLSDHKKDFMIIQDLLDKNQITIIDSHVMSPTLENVFIHLIETNG